MKIEFNKETSEKVIKLEKQEVIAALSKYLFERGIIVTRNHLEHVEPSGDGNDFGLIVKMHYKQI